MRFPEFFCTLPIKGVGAGVFEYRVDFGPGYLIYFGKDGDALVILLGGGKKRTTRSASAGDVTMPLTREFKDTVQARLRQDRKYRKELLREGVESLLAGDLDTGKAILRDGTRLSPNGSE